MTLSFSKLDSAATAYATILSLGCLARGAVHDGIVALLLLGLMPVLYMALLSTKPIYTSFAIAGGVVTLSLSIVMGLQWFSTGGSFHNGAYMLDRGAMLQSLGHLCFILMTFVLALLVGATESSARIFLRSLLISGAVFLALTFFVLPRENTSVSTYYSYTHGFVNPNNAAAYLGLVMLLALAQAMRLFKYRAKSLHKIFIDIVDQLSLSSIFQWGFLLFTLLLVLAGLFMTGSRGGIFLSLLSSAFFCLIIILKTGFQAHIRKVLFISAALIFVSALLWSFINFGQIISDKFARDGMNSNMRFDVFAAIVPMIADHPWLGVGLGGFPAAFQQYRPDTIASDGIIDKAHNSYLEFAAEMGLPAFFILMITIGWLGYLLYRGIKFREERYIIPTLGLSVWGFAALYSLIDFPLQIPGLGAIFLAVITVCVCQSDPRFCVSASSSNAPVKRRRIRKRRSTSHT